MPNGADANRRLLDNGKKKAAKEGGDAAKEGWGVGERTPRRRREKGAGEKRKSQIPQKIGARAEATGGFKINTKKKRTGNIARTN